MPRIDRKNKTKGAASKEKKGCFKIWHVIAAKFCRVSKKKNGRSGVELWNITQQKKERREWSVDETVFFQVTVAPFSFLFCVTVRSVKPHSWITFRHRSCSLLGTCPTTVSTRLWRPRCISPNPTSTALCNFWLLLLLTYVIESNLISIAVDPKGRREANLSEPSILRKSLPSRRRRTSATCTVTSNTVCPSLSLSLSLLS